MDAGCVSGFPKEIDRFGFVNGKNIVVVPFLSRYWWESALGQVHVEVETAVVSKVLEEEEKLLFLKFETLRS